MTWRGGACFVKFADYSADILYKDNSEDAARPWPGGRQARWIRSHFMNNSARGKTICRFSIRLIVLVVGCVVATGCVGPNAIRYTRIKYNEVVHDTNDEQLLLNIVRLRYADSPIFIDLPNITSQFEVSGGSTYNVGFGNQFNGKTSLGLGQVALRDIPTLSFHPREGREIAKSLLTPMTAELFSMVNAGADLEQLLLMTTSDINDVPNAPRATNLIPRAPDDNTDFLRGVRVLASLQQRGAIELGFGTNEDTDNSSDPIPKDAILGRDLLNAAKDGYVYRAHGNGQMTLLKRDKQLLLKIFPQYVHSTEMQEVARIFKVTPGLSHYQIKSELSEDSSRKLPKALEEDAIYLNMRSILQVMTFLSKGVCVPEDHVRSGVAPTTPGPNGLPFDWTRVTGGNFFVHSQKHRPRESEVAVEYRGYWFSIASNDTNSRAVLAILEILFSLQESEGSKSAGPPLLTVPVGG